MASTTTILDVAGRAGVSTKTVSRVLNGEPNVQPETRDRVRAAVEALGYRPNVAARRLAGSRSFLIGLFYDNPSEAYIGRLQLGAGACCRDQGYQLVVEPLDSRAADLPALLARRLDAMAPDGLILTQPISDDDAVLNLLEQFAIPYVRITPDHDLDRAPWVAMDDVAAAMAMTDHLLDLGHRRIGFIEGAPDHGASALRRRGYLAALERRGMTPRLGLIEPGRFDFGSGFEAAERLLDLDEPPTAIFASNDEMALGAIVAAYRRGLNLPDDLSIAGVDDIAAGASIRPQLTTVRQPVREMGAAAVDMIVSREARRGAATWPPHRRLDFQLIVRESTAPPRADRRSARGRPCLVRQASATA